MAENLSTFLTIYRRYALGPAKTGSVMLETAIKILHLICKHVCHKILRTIISCCQNLNSWKGCAYISLQLISFVVQILHRKFIFMRRCGTTKTLRSKQTFFNQT